MDQEELSKRINRKLSEFSPQYEIGAWEAFETYHQKKEDSRRVIAWWSLVAAACLSVLVGSWWYVWLQQADRQQPVRVSTRPKNSKGQPSTNTSSERNLSRMEDTHDPIDRLLHLPSTPQRNTIEPNLSNPKELETKRNDPSVVIGVAANSTHPKKLPASNTRKAFHAPTDDPKWVTKSVTDRPQHDRYARFGNPYRISPEPTIATAGVAIQVLPIASLRLPTHPFTLPMIAIRQSQSELPFQKPSKKEDGLRIGAGITSQANYAQAASASLQPGAFLAAEIPLTSRILIRSGLGILNQAISLTNQPTQQQLSTGTRQLTTASYHWLNIDLPLAIRYNLSRSRVRPVFATLGLSSIAFLNGRYEQEFRTDKRITTTITLLNGQTQQVEQQLTQVEQQQGALTEAAGWEPFRFLNASLGFERLITKQHFLLVEPFAKLPLGGITSENLRFSTFGVQLHWSYQLKRKTKSQAEITSP